jgi:hypothetical protein
MADFPFPSKAIGNLCSKCCSDSKCEEVLGEGAKCCQINETGTTECYDPTKCRECKTISENPLVKKVTNYCEEPSAKGKKDCCDGECYDGGCYDCVDKKVVPLFDPDIEGCCAGAIFSKLECKRCVTFNDKERLEGTCTESKPTCCDGSGECYKEGCDTCEPKTPGEDKKTAEVIKKCKDPTPDCCGEECWNEEKNKCKTCSEDGQVIDRPDCDCCGSGDEQQCCPEGTECCAIQNKCINLDCEACE